MSNILRHASKRTKALKRRGTMPKNTAIVRLPFDRKKFKELILHVTSQCVKDRYWNATKLNKVLFYADFLAFRDHGEPITGAEYFALENGPAPKALLPIREEMI